MIEDFEILDEGFGVIPQRQTIEETDEYSIILDPIQNHLELTKKEAQVQEVDGELETVYVPASVRYHYIGDLDNLNFDELWKTSWLYEEVLVEGDKQVVLNRKHNETVLSKVVKTEILSTEDGEVEQKEWEHKYLPLIEEPIEDVMAKFDEYWQYEKPTTLELTPIVDEYNLAGKVNYDSLYVGDGYENVIANVNIFNVGGGLIKVSGNHYRTVIGKSEAYGQGSGGLRQNLIVGKTYTITIISNVHFMWFKTWGKYGGSWRESTREGSKYTLTIEDDLYDETIIIYDYIIAIKSGVNFTTEEDFFINITETSSRKPLIKGTMPNSKLSLPALAQLGSVVSKSRVGNYDVFKHTNGTTLIKGGIYDTSKPDSRIVFGINAERVDGKWRLVCLTNDGTYPVGWGSLKYDDESDGAVVFYDVGRTASNNNIAGMITVNGQVYIGEGYTNYGCIISDYGPTVGAVEQIGDVITLNSISGTVPSYKGICGVFTLSDSNTYTTSSLVDVRITYRGVILDDSQFYCRTTSTNAEISSNRSTQLADGFVRFETIASWTPIDNQTWKRIVFILPSLVEGEVINPGDLKVEIRKNTAQITKTSYPKPFIATSVPNGALKLAVDWTSESHSYILKNTNSIMYTPSNDSLYTITQNNGKNVGITGFSGKDYYNKNCDIFYNNTDRKLIFDGVSNPLNVMTFTSTIPTGLNQIRLNGSFDQILIYKGSLSQAEMEGELNKSIVLSKYTFQENSVPNTFLLESFEEMRSYSPALTDEEILEEIGKEIYTPISTNIPNYKGEMI